VKIVFEFVWIVGGWVFREKAHYGGRTNIVKGARASAHQKHRVEIFIKQRNMDKLHDVLMRVSDPSHADYGKHWSRDEIFAMTGNAGGSREVSRYLEAHGARVVGRAAYEESLTVEASIGVWEKLLATEFHEFHHEDWSVTGEKMVRSLEYSLPSELHEHVEHVFHVSDFPPKVHGDPVIQNVRSPMSYTSPLGTIYNGYVTPAFLNQLYNIASNTGSALTKQAIFASLGQYFSPNDLSRFQSLMGIPIDRIDGNIGLKGHISDIMCATNVNDCGESNLDVQYLMGIAQNVPTYHMYYENCEYVFMLQNVTASVNPPKVISISYGGYGYPSFYIDIFNQYAIVAGVMGITIVVSSGDDGVANFGARNDPRFCKYEPSFPAFSPYVTAVGATQVRAISN
jgi:tripeptidyl-peptidase-1